MKKILFLLLVPLYGFSQVKYEAQLSFLEVDIHPLIIMAAMPDLDTPKGDTIYAHWNRPDLKNTFVEYNAFEAYLIDDTYSQIKTALNQRFGITINGMVDKKRSVDSTVYGYPQVSKSAFGANSGFYFVKLNVQIGMLEGGPQVTGQTQDNTTITPTIQLSLVLYDKEGKKVKKASAKYQSAHFLKGRVENFTMWDRKTRASSVRASLDIRDTFIPDLVMRGLGKLQENFYK